MSPENQRELDNLIDRVSSHHIYFEGDVANAPLVSKLPAALQDRISHINELLKEVCTELHELEELPKRVKTRHCVRFIFRWFTTSRK
ncbi:hypothetical protein GCM10028806_33150 [Spirosoma terrae]|uniref:Uncharacterized protein n=1 Tax=Spirosoma terrae TaxID=1968276 RepID=A0A6L9LG43_9BACT|nr:hypothetical protein [Spirosoma terrae]NDU95629.1 hypothetical protein [Spirosoma terrae]